VAQAFADRYPFLPEQGRPVIVGYDRRLKSKESAELIASVLIANNIETYLSNDFCPTPCVSWWVKNKKAAAGIMVTASHNPPKWNGIKFKESYGGAASGEFLTPIEEIIDANERQGKTTPHPTLSHKGRGEEVLPSPLMGEGKGEGEKLRTFDPRKEYLEALRKLIDLKLILKTKFKILYDPLYGCGSSFLEELLEGQIETIHSGPDTNFGGIHPEPIQPYVNEAMEKMRSGRYEACIITDGDADRIGAIDEKGNVVSSHQIFALLLKHLVENKSMKGKVIKSISTTVMLDRLCKKYGFPLQVTPIGFKFISPAMKEAGVLIAGEESGGIGMPYHICERDGLFCGLLLLELMATKKKLLGELIADLQKEAGPCFYKRIDHKLPKDQAQAMKEKLAQFKPATLAGKKVKKLDRIDGYHFSLEDDSWLLIRPSGTEPLLRTYAEAPTMEQVETLLKSVDFIA